MTSCRGFMTSSCHTKQEMDPITASACLLSPHARGACGYHVHVAEHHSEAKPLLQLPDAEVQVVRVKEVVA